MAKKLLAALNRIEAIAHYYSRISGNSDEITEAFKAIVSEAGDAIALAKKSNEPELLASLIEYVDEFEYDLTPFNPRYKTARNAIANAKSN